MVIFEYMTWEYIFGFFDADGSITLANPGNSKYKTVSVNFHNNELVILEKIKKVIEKETGVKGFIITKSPRAINHKVSYDLKYDFFQKVIAITDFMLIEHPKKKHRIAVTKKLNDIIPRNGKYTAELLKKRTQLESLFFSVK